MKSLKNILFIAAAVLVIGIQLIYVLTIGQDLKHKISDNENQIVTIETEIEELDKKLELLPQTKEELNKINEEKSAVLNTIPTCASVTKEFLQLNNSMQIGNFFEVMIEHKEEVSHEDEIGSIIEKKYMLTYVSTFAASKQFVEELNASYELINIQNFSVDNSVQTNQDEGIKLIRLWFGDKASELVITKIDFSMFARPNESVSDEIYAPEFNLLHNTESAFFNRDEVDAPAASNTSGTVQTIPVSAEDEVTENIEDSSGKFRLDISDALTSGDTYKFLGPGFGENSYSGLLSSTNAYITVTIKEDGYDVVLEDENGKVKQNSVRMGIKDPSFTIYSKMRQLEDTMPKVQVYIRNYTGTPINVTLDGTLLENIHIYNEFDEEVLKGQTKGKVKLT